MQQLQLWIKKNILLYFLSIFSLGNLFGQTVTISMPNYLKMYTDGIFTYRLDFDTKGRLSSIYTDNKSTSNCIIEYKTENNVVLNYTALNRQKVLNLNTKKLSEFTFTNRDSIEFTVDNQIDKCIFKNSINYIIDSNTKEIICKYEYKTDDSGNCLITYATQAEYDSALNLNWYSVWNDRIIINNFQKQFNNTDINKNNLIILYTYDKTLAQLIYPFYFSSDVAEYLFNNYSASSFLTEDKTMYKADNLRNIAGLPWASGKGYGIGDKIVINLDVRSDLSFAFYNGFQSEQKPYLYESNSRVKKIKITCMQTRKSALINLKDTNKKQIIPLDEIIDGYGEVVDIELEILDVYSGSKYKDVCIQAILPEI